MDPVVSLKRHLSVDYTLCIFCETSRPSSALLHGATDNGLNKVRNAASSRKKLRDSKNTDVINRLDDVLDSDRAATLVWHRNCYAQFTDKSKIERLERPLAEHSKGEFSSQSTCNSGGGNRRSPRKGGKSVDWNECIFCQEPVTKTRLISVVTTQMSKQIIQDFHYDYTIGVRLAGVIDLIAAEAKYHLVCLHAFTRATTKTKQESAKTDIALIWLCEELND